MFEIVVDTEKLRSQARILDNAAVRLNRISERISNLIAGVSPSDYDGLLKRKVQEILAEALNDSSDTANKLTHLRDELNEKAAAFDRVNDAASSALNTINGLLDFSILTGAALSAYSLAGGLFGGLSEAIRSIFGSGEDDITVVPRPPQTEQPDAKSALSEEQQAALAKYDGTNIPDGVKVNNQGTAVNPEVTSEQKSRDRNLYDAVINQFGVESNSRYAQVYNAKGELEKTWCNIFVWDVTSAMGAEIPHYYDPATGAEVPRDKLVPGKYWEMSANRMVDWLDKFGSQNGWQVISADQAQEMANAGHPVVAAKAKPGGIGHVAMVRPGEVDPTHGPTIAQAGASNRNYSHVGETFGGTTSVRYFYHQ